MVESRGFTLLELLVVIALVALATGLVAPNALRNLQAAKERGAIADLEAALAELPAEAFGSGGLLVVNASMLRAKLPNLPDDWQLTMEEPLQYGSNGVAQGGKVKLHVPGRDVVAWRVTPIDGAVVRGSP